MRAAADEVSEGAPLGAVKMFREYQPGERVAARLEISTGGLLRGRDAGLDVMGDGRLVPYARRHPPADPRARGRRDSVRRRQTRAGVSPMKEQDVEVPKGSYAAGRRVRLPRGAEPPIRVYINGVEQREGTDYEVRRTEIAFARPIVKETVTPGRWMAMYLGLFGTYRKHEAVDVEYRLRGKTELAADVEIVPDPS